MLSIYFINTVETPLGADLDYIPDARCTNEFPNLMSSTRPDLRPPAITQDF